MVKDSQSNPNRAAEVAKELIVYDKVDLMLVASTPETTNPVSTQCEIEEVPCISTVAPWQPYFIGRQANPAAGRRHGSRSTTPITSSGGSRTSSRSSPTCGASLQTNKSVGGLFPNDGDGNAWGDKQVGFPPVLDKLGYKLTDPGRYQNLTDDFCAQIAAFKKANCEIITGVVLPPDFTTFWNQAMQQGFKPKVGLDRQSDPVPGRGRGAGQERQQSVVGSLVVAEPSVQVVADRPVGRGHRHGLRKSVRQAMDAADRLRPCAVRGRRRCAQALARDAATTRPIVEGDRRDQARHRGRPDRLGRPNLPPFAAKNIAKTPLVGGQWRLQATAASTTSSSPTTRPRRNSGRRQDGADCLGDQLHHSVMAGLDPAIHVFTVAKTGCPRQARA